MLPPQCFRHVTHAYVCIRDQTLQAGPIQISLILLLFCSLLTKQSPLSVFHPTPSRCHCYIEQTVPSSQFLHVPSFPNPHIIDRASAGAQAAGTSINHFLLNSTQTSARSKFVIVRPQNFVHILLLIIVQCYYWQFDTLSPLSGMGRVVLLRPLFEDAFLQYAPFWEGVSL